MKGIKGMYVNDSEKNYALAIALGIKTIETRSKNMLSALVGETVAIVRTGNGFPATVVGFVYVRAAEKMSEEFMNSNRCRTLISKGGKYDNNRWCYMLEAATMLEPSKCFELPGNTIRHGRSWCEF